VICLLGQGLGPAGVFLALEGFVTRRRRYTGNMDDRALRFGRRFPQFSKLDIGGRERFERIRASCAPSPLPVLESERYLTNASVPPQQSRQDWAEVLILGTAERTLICLSCVNSEPAMSIQSVPANSPTGSEPVRPEAVVRKRGRWRIRYRLSEMFPGACCGNQ